MSIKLTFEQIEQNLLKWGKKDNILYKIKKYNGNKSDIRYHCLKCGYIGSSKYYNLQQGYRCKKCGIKKRSEKRRKYTKEYCKNIINKCKNIREFYSHYRNVYQACVKNKWLNELASNLKRENSLKKRCLYAIYFPNKVAYIGLTFNFEKRMYEHLYVKGSVYEYIKTYSIKPINKKILLQNLEENKVQKLEKRIIKYFTWLGYTLLNKCDGGSLGQITSHISKSDCKKILKSINYNIHIFRSDYAKYYNKCIREKWLNEFIPDLKISHRYDYTIEELKEKVKEFNNRSECYKLDNKLYSYIQRNGLLDKVFTEIPNQKVKKSIKQYTIDGNYITSFNSISEASKQLHISSGSIIACCQGQYFKAGNFQWKYANSDKKILDNKPKKIGKKIYQYDDNKILVKEFNSIKEASLSTNIAATSISACSLKKRKRAGGFVWISEDNIDDINFYYKDSKGLVRKVYQYDFNDNLIKTYKNTIEASKITHICRTAINNCLLKKSKSAGGYIWKYSIYE